MTPWTRVATRCACSPACLAQRPFRVDRMQEAARGGFSTATDVADYLVRRGITFRQAHEVVGRLVRHCIERNCDLPDIPIDDLKGFSSLFDEDFYLINVDSSVRARDVQGGTAPAGSGAPLKRVAR